MSDILQKIRDLQHVDKQQAEQLLLEFIEKNFNLSVEAVQLTPLAVSLNSFNGFLYLSDGTRQFFKTHTETDTVISEYYNAAMLANAGYPVIQPIFNSTEPGKQLLLYDVIEDKSVFDIAWEIESGDDSLLSDLRRAQHQADAALLDLYRETLEQQSASEAAGAPIHQLFFHRLTGGRLDRFYGAGSHIHLPLGTYSMKTVREARWVINGQIYDDTLDDIIARAITVLNPGSAGPSVIGHGDAHNGNVFFKQNAQSPELVYFDPAFAGRHHPLLDITKPLFHNVFAMWMYFPVEKAHTTTIKLDVDDSEWRVEYSYAVPEVRRMFLDSKIENVLIPILRILKSQSSLIANWRTYIKSALFCCPFLTMDLSDPTRFPPEISLLGLIMSVEMGAESKNRRSLIDQQLDAIEEAL